MVNLGSALISSDQGRLKKDGSPLLISRPAEQIFKILLSSPNRLVTKEELLASVWPDRVVEENNLQVHISAIRKIVGLDRTVLETVSGRGYRLNVPAPEGELEVAAAQGLNKSATTSSNAHVHIVDDETAVRTALVRQLRSAGITATSHASAEEFLHACDFSLPSCLLLDVRLSAGSGFDLQADLAKRQAAIPIVFMTGFGTIDMSVRAMKAGAESFLTKPMDESELLRVVREAMINAEVRHAEMTSASVIRSRYALLTEREKAVFDGLVSGYMNKEIATALGLQEVTIKAYKKNVMLKLGAAKLVDLIEMSRMIFSDRVRKIA